MIFKTFFHNLILVSLDNITFILSERRDERRTKFEDDFFLIFYLISLLLIHISYLVKKTAVPTTTISSIPSKTELVSILEQIIHSACV